MRKDAQGEASAVTHLPKASHHWDLRWPSLQTLLFQSYLPAQAPSAKRVSGQGCMHARQVCVD